MALEEKTVTIPMRFGQDEGTDKGSDLNGLMAIENGIYDKEGALRPRFGFQQEVSFDDDKTRGLVLAGHTLGVVTRNTVKNYVPGSGTAPTTNGFGHSSQSREVTAFHGGRNILGVDLAVVTGTDGVKYAATISDESIGTANGSVWVRIFNYETGAMVFSQQWTPTLYYVDTVRVIPTGISSSAETAFLFAVQGSTLVGDANSKIVAVRVDPVALTFGTFYTVTSDSGSTDVKGCFDVIKKDIFTYFGYGTSATQFKVTKCLTSGDPQATSAAATEPSDTSAPKAVTIMAPGGTAGSWIVAAYSDNSVSERIILQSFNSGSLALGTSHVTGLVGSASSSFRNVAIDADPASLTDFRVYATLAGSFDTLADIKHKGFLFNDTTGVISSVDSVHTVTGLQIVSKPFRYGPSNGESPSMLVVHSSSAQHFYLGMHVLDLTVLNITATLAADEGRPYNTSSVSNEHYAPCNVPVVAEDKLAFVLPVALESASATDINGGTPLVYRARITELDFTAAAVPYARIEDTTYLSGSVVREFDGRRPQEATIMSAPLKPSVATSAGTLPAGTYQFVTVIEQTDRFGNVRLSPPSAVTTVVSGSTVAFTVTTTNTVLPVADLVTGLDDSRVIRTYRTAVDGSVFYLLLTQNEPGSIDGSLDDASLSLADQLDITGILSEPVPALRSLWSHGNRLFGILAESPRILRYTQSMEQPSAPSWSGFFLKNIETTGGDLVAGGSLPGKCILFQEDQILVMGGRGPSNAGPDAGGDGFDDPEPVSNGVGAVDAVCIVPIPGGILFRAKTGFHVIANDCSVTFVGQGVQDREAAMGRTTMAQYIPSFHQVWISGENSPDIMVFDTRFGRWSTLSGPWLATSQVVGSQEIDGVSYLLTNGDDEQSAIWTYQDGVDTDEDGSIPAHTLDTPWFKGPGDGSTFRVWSVIVTLRIPSDADSTDVRLKTYTVSHNDPDKDPEVEDTNRIYSFSGTGAKAGIKTIRVKPVKQRCAAFRCQIEVSNGTTVPVSVVSVKYVYGVESESAKTPNRAEGQVG